MADKNPDSDEVRIFQPDTALKEKLGPNASFDQIVSPQAIAAAQDVITQSSDDILAALKADLMRLQHGVDRLAAGQAAEAALQPVIEAAFAIKSKAGLCGYPFASALAKSLHVFCELDTIRTQPLAAKSIQIIRSQAAGLRTVFTNKITGDGGKVGAAILGELQKLSQDS
jgi:hypothetical protein